MSNRVETYGKYIYRRVRAGKTEVFARVGYTDENGKRKYKYEKAETEEHAARLARQIIADLADEKLDGELCEIFFAVREKTIGFTEFKSKIKAFQR